MNCMKVILLFLTVIFFVTGCDDGTEDLEIAEKLADEYLMSGIDNKPSKPYAIKSIQHLQLASDKGNIEASIRLGRKYYYGKFLTEKKNTIINQDYKKARELFYRAANKGNTNAAYILAWMSLRGQGGDESKREAARWFKEVRKDKDFWSIPSFSLLNSPSPHRHRLTPDNISNKKLLIAAAELDDPYAQNLMGWQQHYTNNQKLASHWFEKSARGGYPHSQYEIGSRYLNGDGVLRDHKRAYMWFSIAEYKGHSLATDLLELMNDELPQSVIIESQEAAKVCLESNYKNC